MPRRRPVNDTSPQIYPTEIFLWGRCSRNAYPTKDFLWGNALPLLLEAGTHQAQETLQAGMLGSTESTPAHRRARPATGKRGFSPEIHEDGITITARMLANCLSPKVVRQNGPASALFYWVLRREWRAGEAP